MRRQEKTIIKINFTDFWAGFDIHTSFFYKLLATKYEIEISENPDILFYSVFSNNHQKYNCTKVLYTGENIRPNFKECDFAFSYDYPVTDRNFRLPLYALYDDVNKLIHKKVDVVAELKKKNKFCCFIVSNPCCEIRNNFFLALSKRKHVDSAGKLYNNIDGNIENKREFINQYKFVIAFENESNPGFVTEKIFEPLLENCVPIYWGSDQVHKDFNTDRFINCHDFESFDAVIDHILAVDADDDAYMKYLTQPPFKNNELPSFVKNENILAQLDKIIEYSKKNTLDKLIRQTIRPLIFFVKKIENKIRLKIQS